MNVGNKQIVFDRQTLLKGFAVTFTLYVLSALSIISLLYFPLFGEQGWFASKGMTDIQAIILLSIVIIVCGIGLMLALSFGICRLILSRPRVINLPLKLHKIFQKSENGLYFVIRNKHEISVKTAVSRSVYGAILLLGVGFRIASGPLLGAGEFNMEFSFSALITILCLLPFVLLFLYVSPWVIREGGIYHVRSEDRTTRNVGDWLEDFLEFFVGIDIILTLVEYLLTVGIEWFLVTLVMVFGPLFSLVLLFTMVFFNYKPRIIEKYREYLREEKFPHLDDDEEMIKEKLVDILINQAKREEN